MILTRYCPLLPMVLTLLIPSANIWYTYLTLTCKPTNEGWSDSLWPLTIVTCDADMLWDGDQDSCSLQWCRHPGSRSGVFPFALVALCSSLLTYVAVLVSLGPSPYFCFSWLLSFLLSSSTLLPPSLFPPLPFSSFCFSISLLIPFTPSSTIISTPSFPISTCFLFSLFFHPNPPSPPPPPSLSVTCAYGRWSSEGGFCRGNRELPQHGGYTLSHRGDRSTSSKFTVASQWCNVKNN